jgi:hypothetical protein
MMSPGIKIVLMAMLCYALASPEVFSGPVSRVLREVLSEVRLYKIVLLHKNVALRIPPSWFSLPMGRRAVLTDLRNIRHCHKE